MLQKDLNVTTNLFVIEDACTEATVQTSLTSQYDEESNTIPSQDQSLIRNEIPNTPTSIAIAEAYKLQTMNNKISKDEKSVMDPSKNDKCSEKLKECFQILQNDIPTEYPILYKTSDGSYMNVTNEMIKNLAQSGAIHYQVVHDDGHLGDLQQYICSTYSDMQINNEEMNKDCDMQQKSKPMSLKQLVDETVAPEFTTDKSYLENINTNLIISGVSTITSQTTMNEDIPEAANEEVVTDIPFNNFVTNGKDVINYVPQENETMAKTLGTIDDSLDSSSLPDDVLNDSMSDRGMDSF